MCPPTGAPCVCGRRREEEGRGRERGGRGRREYEGVREGHACGGKISWCYVKEEVCMTREKDREKYMYG